jgi:hypothetical protein
MFTAGQRATVPLSRRDALAPGQDLNGPAVIAEDLATTVVEPGSRASVTADLDLLLTRAATRPGSARSRALPVGAARALAVTGSLGTWNTIPFGLTRDFDLGV